VAYLPLTFVSDTGPIQTKACLQVTERIYPETKTWQGFGPSADGPEKAMESLIAVFKRKDREALWQMSDAVLGRDPKQFDDQANAYFSQFETAEIASIPRAYEFAGFVVFFARLHWTGQTFSSAFIFHRGKDGAFGFLPYRTNDLTFQLVREWFDTPWGPGKAAEPSHCSTETVSHLNLRVPTSTSIVTPVPYLYLKGAPVAESNLLAGVNATLQGMKKALADDDWIDPFSAYLAPAGSVRLKEWYRTADQRDKRMYKQHITEQEPFFIFDASPLVVVYTRTPSRLVQVMYFLASGNHLVWTNATRATVVDKLFKSGPLFEAAMLDKPFNLEIK
jgi:hypothetical protein